MGAGSVGQVVLLDFLMSFSTYSFVTGSNWLKGVQVGFDKLSSLSGKLFAAVSKSEDIFLILSMK